MPRFPYLANAGLVAISIALPLVAAEVCLRFLPVYSAFHGYAPDSVYRFQPNQTYTYSRGWDLHGAQTVRTNSDGWVNPQPYDSTLTSPLLAIVGDSYVEALMVPFDSSLGGRLARQVRTYTFGVSGAPLSQYLAEARWAARYRPSALVVVVIANDFDESLERYRITDRFYEFNDSLRWIAPRPATRSRARSMLTASALARYFVLNAQIRRVFGSSPTVANTSASLDANRVAGSLRVIDAFLNRLPEVSGLPVGRIAFVVDPVRPEVYHGAPSDSYAERMRTAFIQGATARGYEVIDPTERFRALYARDRRGVEFPDDGHWDRRGHAAVAEAIQASALYRSALR